MSNSFILAIALFTVALSSCSGDSQEKDEQFCKCLEVTAELNDYSERLFTKDPTEEDEKKMQELRKSKNKECEEYVAMSGEEMLKRKELCK